MTFQPVTKPLIGWREWVSLPELGIVTIHAKIDTGARSSALHADDFDLITRGKSTWVRFVVRPRQRAKVKPVVAEAPFVEFRTIRSSFGATEERPVIRTSLAIGQMAWVIEVTLARRHMMGFPMLIGRKALRGRFLVNPARSYLAGPRLSPRKRHPS